MSKRLPYMPMYIGDFLRTTAGWSLEEQAVYIRLLMHQWDADAKCLPGNTERLARMVGVDHQKFTEIWITVSAEFESSDARGLGPEIRNEALEQIRTKNEAWREKQREGGRLGAAKRWKRSVSDASGPCRDGDDRSPNG